MDLKHFTFTKHPVADVLVPPLSAQHLAGWLRQPKGVEMALAYREQHEAMIREALADPLRKGFDLAFWRDVWELMALKKELLLMGGNGTGKTEIGAKMVVQELMKAPNRKVLCMASNEEVSKALQQAAVYRYLPAEVRRYNEQATKKRMVYGKMNWSQDGGFTEGTFVLPHNRSQCWFKTEAQYIKEPKAFEGPEYHFAWLDEPMVAALVNTLKDRLGKLAGKLLYTLTMIYGLDPSCAKALTGARLLRSLPMDWMWDPVATRTKGRPAGTRDFRVIIPELSLDEVQVKDLPPGHMPYIMQPLNLTQAIIFCWTQWNPFLPRSESNPAVPETFEKQHGRTKQAVRARLFGWAEQTTGCQFPPFNVNVHCSDAVGRTIDTLLAEKALTSYQGGDPASARSYAFLWLGVDRRGRKFIFDESPRTEEGEWVNVEGKKGDGQIAYAGKGVNFYKQYIHAREREHGTPARRRFGDPRAFATEAHAADGGKSLFDLFLVNGGTADEYGEPDGTDPLRPMRFEAAKVKRSLVAEAASGSLDLINTALTYDEKREISAENEPRLYIHPRCVNLIQAMLNWDPSQGEKSPWKDFVDVLRYLFGEELYWLDPAGTEIVSGAGW